MNATISIKLTGLAVIAALGACGQLSGGTDGRPLAERRQAIADGSAEGVVLIPARKPEAASPAAPQPASPSTARPPAPLSSNVPGPASAAAPVAAPAASPAAKPKGGLLDKLPPPGGRPLNAAKTLQAPDLGLPVPSTGSASQPAAGSR